MPGHPCLKPVITAQQPAPAGGCWKGRGMGGKPKGANILKLLIMVFIVGAGGWFTYLKIREHNMQSAVHQEQMAQEPELKMCCDRLTQFSQAWSAYTKDH